MAQKYLVNTLLNSKITFAIHFLELLHKTSVKMQPKIFCYDKTPYVWRNKFTPVKKFLHNRWLSWLRHI